MFAFYVENFFIEKKSKFIGSLCPVKTEEEAIAFIQSIKAQHPQARHHVYAYILRKDNTMRYSDAGEPSGTGGQPMLGVLRREELTDVCVVTTRYFGGILLGAGGLVRAYTKGAKIAVDAAGKSMKRVWSVLYMPIPYTFYERIKLEVAAFGGIIRDTQFGAEIELEILVAAPKTQSFLDRITDMTSGTVEGMEIGQEYRAFPVEEECV